ncbi:hypothetical protein AJ78_05595 [Emergomyces pasteurianus Ep9510]|uniref:Uncharacterized protein n=1 Tax=Emergomyces pasteurianus Ep9510 TaxID=1447872 RepID=A0A1J9PBW8_9EURO|nr:hypothetical protein AJ78_05595 [Emergomyces pasteurianus Ep9510]
MEMTGQKEDSNFRRYAVNSESRVNETESKQVIIKNPQNNDLVPERDGLGGEECGWSGLVLNWYGEQGPEKDDRQRKLSQRESRQPSVGTETDQPGQA